MNLPQTLLVSLLSLVFLLINTTSKAQEESQKTKDILANSYDILDLHQQFRQPLSPINIDSVIANAKQARLSALNEKDDKGVARALLVLGTIDLRLDSTIPARIQLHQALGYAEKCECDSLKASILYYLGMSYLIHDNYSESISNYLQSLEIAEEIADLPFLAELYDEIGLVMALLEDFDQAMVYFNKALEVDENYGDIKNHAKTIQNIAFIFQQRNKHLEAEGRYIEALKLFEEIDYTLGRATTTGGIGNSEFAMGNYQTALKYYQEAIKLATKMESRYEITGRLIQAIIYNRLGETYLKLNQYDKSVEVLKKASELSEKFDMPASLAESSYLFSQIYERKGNIVLAYDYFKEYNELSDSIINARNVSTITKLEMEYQYLKLHKEREIKQIETEEAYKRKVLVYQLLIGVSVIISILLIVILIMYRKNQRNKTRQAELAQKNLELKKDKLEKELDYKNRELTTSVMYQLKKNNFIWSVSEKLKNIAMHLRPEIKKTISDIIKEMDSNMTKESWEEFEFRFNEVHNDFYDNLIKDFPDLTPNELKLSAFLKLNMTSKDIATITYQSSHSITVARHRLRAKLGIERDDNLISFLSKY